MVFAETEFDLSKGLPVPATRSIISINVHFVIEYLDSKRPACCSFSEDFHVAQAIQLWCVHTEGRSKNLKRRHKTGGRVSDDDAINCFNFHQGFCRQCIVCTWMKVRQCLFHEFDVV